MSESPLENRPPDEAPDRSRLECIGSFKAFTEDKKVLAVEIWTHFSGVHDRDYARVEAGLLILTTTDGRGVDRISQGHYRLRDDPKLTLSTTDPKAP
jgi:hypothetical protein